MMPSNSTCLEHGCRGSQDGIGEADSKLLGSLLKANKMKKADLNEDEADMLDWWIGSELCEEHSGVVQLSKIEPFCQQNSVLSFLRL